MEFKGQLRKLLTVKGKQVVAQYMYIDMATIYYDMTTGV